MNTFGDIGAKIAIGAVAKAPNCKAAKDGLAELIEEAEEKWNKN